MSPHRSIEAYAETLLDAFANSEQVVVGLVDLEGRLLAGNTGLARAAGRSLDELLGRTIWDAMVRPDDEPMVRAVLAAIGQGAPAMSAENPWQRPDGSLKPMRWFNIPVRDADGVVMGVLGFGHDAELHETLRVRAVEAEQRFRMLEAAIDEVFYISDLAAGRLQYASPGFERLWELPVSTLLDDVRQFLERIDPADRPAMTAALDRQLRGERTEQEYRLLFPDGRRRWIRDRSYPIVDGNGNVTRVVGVASDVTSHRHDLERLADREQLLSAVFNRSSHALWLLSPDGAVLEINQTAANWLGTRNPTSFGELPWLSDADRNAAVGLLAAALRGGTARCDVHVRGAQQELVLDLSVRTVPNPEGVTRYVLAEAMDITQRLIDRRERDEAEQRLAMAFEATSEGVWDWSLQDDSAFFSPRWCRNLGYRPNEVAPTPAAWCELLHPDDHEVVCSALRRLLAGEIDQLRIEARLRTREGGWFWSLTRARVVEWDAKRAPLRVVGTDTDIGHIKEAEARIRALNETLEQRVLDRTEALAKASRAKDEFLAVMSHELRTPMTAVLGVAESIAEGVYGSVNKAQRDALALLETSGQHLLDLIGDLLDLSKLDAKRLEVQFVSSPVHRIVQDVEKLITGIAAKAGLTLEVSVSGTSGQFEADPVRVRQILVNLLSNAIKFAPPGTRVRLLVSGDVHRVTFRVQDEGPGIPMDELDRLFRPFEQVDMQLARKYGGLGLGLALVHRLTALHGGSVSVQCEPGQGAYFDVVFPRKVSFGAVAPHHSGRVLLVGEADDTLRRRAALMEAAGFTVTLASDLEEAHGRILLEDPALILVDSDANPMEVVRDAELRGRRVVVVMSVITASWRSALQDAFGSDQVIEAPCTTDDLMGAVRIAMSRTIRGL